MTDHDCTVFFLPGLGFGAGAATPIPNALGERFRVVGIDLPGQGNAPDAPDGSVHAMVDAALNAIETEADGGPWLLAAHSMGGKVAALVAARVLSGRAHVFGLTGLVLLAPSPPTPEPMDDKKRAEMLAWAEHGALSEANAREFVAQNVASPLADDAEQDAVTQVRRTSPLSWRRWLTDGSRADVSAQIDSLDLPVVVMAGEDDADLGASAQPQLLDSVYPRARFVSLPSTGHLLPYERAAEVAAEITRLSEQAASPAISAEWGRVMASPRTGIEERALLARRAIADDPHYAPRALSPGQLATLRALADRLVPQSQPPGPPTPRIDLAARIDADLAAGRGDGWRPAGLPDDASAYRIGLDAIAVAWPDDAAGQHELISAVIAGEHNPHGHWSADELRRWFDDARTDLVRTWLAHPASLARIGYDGFATSGEGVEPVGYVSLAAGTRDPWEPSDLGALAPEHTTTHPGAAGEENNA